MMFQLIYKCFILIAILAVTSGCAKKKCATENSGIVSITNSTGQAIKLLYNGSEIDNCNTSSGEMVTGQNCYFSVSSIHKNKIVALKKDSVYYEIEVAATKCQTTTLTIK